jgi:hypothetical protein
MNNIIYLNKMYTVSLSLTLALASTPLTAQAGQTNCLKSFGRCYKQLLDAATDVVTLGEHGRDRDRAAAEAQVQIAEAHRKSENQLRQIEIAHVEASIAKTVEYLDGLNAVKIAIDETLLRFQKFEPNFKIFETTYRASWGIAKLLPRWGTSLEQVDLKLAGAIDKLRQARQLSNDTSTIAKGSALQLIVEAINEINSEARSKNQTNQITMNEALKQWQMATEYATGRALDDADVTGTIEALSNAGQRLRGAQISIEVKIKKYQDENEANKTRLAVLKGESK